MAPDRVSRNTDKKLPLPAGEWPRRAQFLSYTCPGFFLNNQPDAPIIQIYFVIKLHFSGIFCAHHQEFSTVHSAPVSFMQFYDCFQAEKTPDVGQRRCPKNVEFYVKINLDNWCVWLVIQKEIKNLSRCRNTVMPKVERYRPWVTKLEDRECAQRILSGRRGMRCTLNVHWSRVCKQGLQLQSAELFLVFVLFFFFFLLV
jgi:hypothetical protein